VVICNLVEGQNGLKKWLTTEILLIIISISISISISIDFEMCK
jgi:hypothetical protein